MVKTKLTQKELLWIASLVGTNFDLDDEEYEKEQCRIDIKLTKMIREMRTE